MHNVQLMKKKIYIFRVYHIRIIAQKKLDHTTWNKIICITVRENRIFCCQIFCDLLFKSAFERIFNVMQLILVKIKWKYLIKKFHDICLLYYFNIQRSKKNWITQHETNRFLNNHCQECVRAYLSIHDCLSFLHEVMIGNHRNKTTES
jgi:hypothetical protein